MFRIAKASLLTVITVVALSGCLRYNIDLTLASDNTASGTVVTAVQEGVGEQVGAASDQEALDELFADSPFATSDGQFVASDYSEEGWVGKTYAFEGFALDELDAFEELFTVERVGDEFVLTGDVAPVNADELDQVPTGAESLLAITFPGEVTSHNGTLEGNTVTWDLFAQTEPLAATADATLGTDLTILWVAIAAIVALLLIAAVVLFVVLRRGRGATGAGAPVGVAPTVDDVTPTGTPVPLTLPEPMPDASSIQPPAETGSTPEEPKE